LSSKLRVAAWPAFQLPMVVVKQEDPSWQNNLVRCVACLTCVGIIFVLSGVSIVASSPSGPQQATNDGIVTMATPIMVIAAASLLVMYLGVLRERQALEEKLPAFTPFRCVVLLVLGVLVAPLRHLGFGILIFAVMTGMVLSCFGQGTFRAKLWGLAICDALLSLAQAEAARRGGSAGDLAMARIIVFIYGTLGAVILPCLSILSTLSYLPRVSLAACLGYGALTAHCALVFLQAFGGTVSTELSGGGYIYEGPTCIFSDVRSPLAIVLDTMSAMVATDKWEGPIGPQAPCPTNETQAALDAAYGEETTEVLPPIRLITCESLDPATLAFFVVLGIFAFSLLGLNEYWKRPPAAKRVVPEENLELEEEKPKTNWWGKPIRREVKLLIFAAVGMAVVIPLANIGLACPFEPSEVSDAGNANSSLWNTTTTTTYLPYYSGGRLLLDLNESVNDSNDSNDSNASLENATLGEVLETSTEAPETSTTTFTATVTITTTTVTYTLRVCNDTGADEAGKESVEAQGSCGCSGNGAKGIIGLVTVASEQVAVVWCEMGLLASMLLAITGFMVHSYALSLAVEQRRIHLREAERKRMFSGTVVQRMNPDEPVRGPEEIESGAIIIFSEAPIERVPLPTTEVGANRLFSL